MRIAFFGSSLVSSYWNGAATYYRGIVHALAERGHEIVFHEPDAYDRQSNRDIADPPWARVVVWNPSPRKARELVESVDDFDVVVKNSGVGVLDEELESEVASLRGPLRIFWDVDAAATLDRLEGDDHDPLRALVPEFDVVLTYGGGDPVVQRYHELGAAACAPVYNAVDPETHHPVEPEERFGCDLAFLGNRLPDRERRVEDFFFAAAARAPERSFLLGGSGWEGKALPANVRLLGHVGTAEHNALNSTPLAVLNVTRESMVANGWSPATRVFEAAGAGACLITDAWPGIDLFLEPGREVLVADGADEVAGHLDALDPSRAAAIGDAARERVLRDHTYAQRAGQVEELLGVVMA
jgi:spore maturation protein CgeB